MSRRTLPGTLDFLFKKFYLTLFPESARTTIGLLTTFFSVGTSKLRSRCPQHISEERIFEKKSFLKFSIRHWGSFFETPGESFAAGFSKLHFSCHEGTSRQKKYFVQNVSARFLWIWAKQFLDFQQIFFRQFCQPYIFPVQISFLRGSFHDQLNHRSKKL